MNEDLRAELVSMFDEDQTAVKAFLADAENHRVPFEAKRLITDTPWPYSLLEWEPEHDAPDSVRRVLTAVHRHTARLQEIVKKVGWPGRRLVGEDGADAAWLLLQHAGSGVRTIRSAENHAFRRSCIPLLEQAVAAGEAHPRHLAATVDGVRSAEGEPSEFGVLSNDYSVVDGNAQFRRPVDPAAIDRRRAEIGLPPLESDVARRARGEWLNYAGPYRSEPWPEPRP